MTIPKKRRFVNTPMKTGLGINIWLILVEYLLFLDLFATILYDSVVNSLFR